MLSKFVGGLFVLSLLVGNLAIASDSAASVGDTVLATDSIQNQSPEHTYWHFITCVCDDHECEHEAEHHKYDHWKTQHDHKKCTGHEHLACYGGHH